MKNIKLSELSKKDKLAIAEYIYSQQTGVLIKSDAENVIKVLKAHNVKEAETVSVEEYAVLNLINSSISSDDINIIIKEYYSCGL